MTKTSCIRYTPNTQLVLIRAELISIFKDAPDAACAAAIMNVFAYWTDIKLESTKQAKIENEIARREGKEPTQDESLWIYKSNGELTHTDLMSIWGEKKVGDCLRWLVECGLILSRRNPRFGYDRTLQYRLDTDAFQECIDTKVLPMPQNCAMESAELRNGSRNIALTIPEITSKVTSKSPAASAEQTKKAKVPKVVPIGGKPKSKNELWETVLKGSFGIDYEVSPETVDDITRGRVNKACKVLKARGFTATHLQAFYADYPNWRPNLSVTRDAVSLATDVKDWLTLGKFLSTDPSTDTRWTATHAAWVHALEIPRGDWSQYLTRSEERIRTDLAYYASTNPQIVARLAELGYSLELEVQHDPSA